MTDLTLPLRLDPDSPPNETLHVTASGLPVLIYNTNGGGTRPIHGAAFENGEWSQRSWRANGSYGHGDSANDFDLRDRPKAKRGVWVAWWQDDSIDYARTYKTQAEALNAKHPLRDLRGIVYVQEGDGLDTPADPPLWVDWAKLPGWAKWAAADEDGEVWGYDKKPDLGHTVWLVPNFARRCATLAKSLYRLAPGFDWRKTLIQRPEDV